MTRAEHLLTCLVEECNEVGQAVSKMLRFGVDDKHCETGEPAVDILRREVIDMLAVMEMLLVEDILPQKAIPINFNYMSVTAGMSMLEKKAKIERFMDYARSKGALSDD